MYDLDLVVLGDFIDGVIYLCVFLLFLFLSLLFLYFLI